MNMRMARHDRPGQHEKIARHRVEVAHRPVRDDAGAAEPLMDMRLHLTPEGAEAGVGRIDVLDDREAWQRLGGDVLVIAEADAVGALPVARMRLARADHRRSREGDDWLHLRKTGDQRTAGKADRAPRRDDDFESVADRRGIPGAQRLEAVAIGQAGHNVSPAGQGSPGLGATPSGRKGFSAAPLSRIICRSNPKGMPMSYTVSHFEIRARDPAAMEKFYTEVLGFIVSDRGALDAGPMKGRELIFLSHSPEEHHQIVLIPSDAQASGSGIGPVALRVDSLDARRRVSEKVRKLPHAKPEPVSHANTWSGYFRDPEQNRIEG